MGIFRRLLDALGSGSQEITADRAQVRIDHEEEREKLEVPASTVLRVVERKLAVDEFREEQFEEYLYPCFWDKYDDDFLAAKKVRHVIVLDVIGALEGVESRQVSERTQRLVDRGERNVALNLAALTRVDEIGLGEIVRSVVMLKREHGALALVNVPDRFHQLVARHKFL
jgi:anti-anti-sigma factor